VTGSMSGHDGTARPDIALRQAISRVSEAAMCASWDADTAFAVWAMAQGEQRRWLDASLDDPTVAALICEIRRLADDAHLWWMQSVDGVIPVPLEQWRQIYRRYAGNG
jgi:hypothetical protein